jgi:AraC-like DNA-binding protein
MARNVRAAQLEAVPRPVIAVGNRYAAGHRHPPHRHRRAQLLVAESGAMLVDTSEGGWMIPPGQALWIPGGVSHGMTMLSRVATCSAYLEPATAPGLAGRCRVVGLSPLLRQLLIEAVDLPAEYDPVSRDGRVMSLLIDEIRRAPEQALRLPLPDDARLAANCRRFLAMPSAQDTIDQWSRALAMSRRTFTRRFRRETGLSFAEWQRRACLLASLPRLANGERITTIAYDLGYASPAAFTAMFKQFWGVSPDAYRRTRPFAKP